MPRTGLVVGLETFVSTLALSALHRLLAFPPLAADRLPAWSEGWMRAMVVGLLSDAWICALAGTLLGLVGTALAATRRHELARGVEFVFLFVFGLLLAGHLAYVDFFHIQIAPYHLHYLTDWSFLAASSRSLLTWQPLAILAATVGVAAALRYRRPFTAMPIRRVRWTAFALVLLCTYGHTRNIYYRIQWFVPENLQMHPAEHLFARLEADRPPPTLAPAQILSLGRLLGSLTSSLATAAPATPGFSLPPLYRVLTRPVFGDPAPAQPLAIATKAGFASRLAAGKKPVVLILLLESMRPSETGYFAPDAGPSLTPSLDALAAHGLVFDHAFSTGSVTRGAQEATFCGYLGSRDTSLMRGDAVARVDCLPDLVRRGGPQGRRGTSFWYHGGDGRFDGQVPYWHLHGVEEFMTRSDFPETTPRTGWGVGDKDFLRMAADRLAALHATTKSDYLLGMNLTVTNHIPWDLPEDAGDETKQPRTKGHESYATTAYADAALGEFIGKLRASHLWDDLLLIVSSDHGNDLPPLVDLYPNASGDEKTALRQSHINLIVSGGIMDGALASQGVSVRHVPDVVSQADVAPFVGYVLDLPDARFMGQNLLRQGRSVPVLSSLEGTLMDHTSGRLFSREDIVTADVATLPVDAQRAVLYYRALLQFIYSRTGDAAL